MKGAADVDLVMSALGKSHSVDIRCTAQFGTDNIGDVSFIAGNVIADESATIRGQLSLTIPVKELYADEEFDPRDIDINGWRLFIEYGVKVGAFEVIYVPVGTYVVYSLEDSDDDRGRLIDVTAYDTTVQLRDDDIELPTPIASGTQYSDAMSTLVQDAGLNARFPATNFTSPGLMLKEGDGRLQKLNDMAMSVGWGGIKSDPFGTIVDASSGLMSGSLSVWDFVEGDDCKMTTLSRSRTRDGVYNIAIVIGEPPGSSSPAYGVAYDDDPESPTFVNATTQGAFGRKPVYYRSQLVTTTAQANLAAISLRDSKKGIGAALKIDGWVNPLLEPGDQVAVKRERYDIDKIIPLRRIEFGLMPGSKATYITREAIFR